jgi:hypothetical protein
MARVVKIIFDEYGIEYKGCGSRRGESACTDIDRHILNKLSFS